ncbi:MAG: hypothetical protein LBF70_00385, partial [Holosporales bacterium]|nr:hypothetical protein [Holosporales bacterium]
MFKHLLCFAIVISTIILDFCLRSSVFDNYYLLFVKGNNLASIMSKDKLFGEVRLSTKFIFHIVEKICKVKTGEYIIYKGENILSVIQRMIRNDT